ncbi:hypothetical protein G3M48_006489 [Beauveria asiatica]|uniref:NACHT-NTPase and P-loop NTPases N-terminal domain-containing protein n=1 Tax=Beauveria asiatica TaxID=1069075 RepID=A0AAW0RPN1_9HYPO
MAEVVGVVAAGIAFGEVVIKISSHVFTLKHMWKEFKEMPDSIKQLVGDIELLGSVLQEMEADMTSSTADGIVWGGGVGNLIVEACRSALNTLSLSVNDVSQEVRATRGIKAALKKGKMVLNKDFWAKTEKRLQDVVGRLQIAQQWWLLALSKRQTDLIVCHLQSARIKPQRIQGEAPSETRQEMHNVPNQRHRTYTPNQPADQRQNKLIQKHLGRTIIGSMAVERARSSDGSMNGTSCDKYYIQIKPPNWITRKAWSIVSSISSSGFNLNLRYAIVGSCDIRVIATMVDWGLDLTRCLDPREESSSSTIPKLIRNFSAFRSVHEYAVAKNLDKDIADCWLLPSYTNDLRYLLWIDGKVQREDIKKLDEMRLPLINVIASTYSLHIFPYDSGCVESWRQLSREIAGLTTLLHSTGKPPQVILKALDGRDLFAGTALFTILKQQTVHHSQHATRGLSRSRRRAIERSLQSWLEDLQRGGIDLEKYGQEEEEIFRKMNWFRSKDFQFETWPPTIGNGPTTYAIIGFSYGPEPKDWKFEWELDTDELVGEFWELIDNQEIRIIGAWVD